MTKILALPLSYRSMRICFQCCFQTLHSMSEIDSVKHICNTHFPLAETWCHIKSLGRSNHDRLPIQLEIAQKEYAEILCICNRKFGNKIKSTLWDTASDSRNRAQLLHNEISSILIFSLDPIKIFSGCLHCSKRSDLLNIRWTEACLRKLHGSFEHCMISAYQCPNSGTTHTVPFRERIDNNDPICILGIQ